MTHPLQTSAMSRLHPISPGSRLCTPFMRVPEKPRGSSESNSGWRRGSYCRAYWGNNSGRVRERFRHRSSKFIARRPPQCRALMKTKSTCNFSLKSSALTEMSISLAPWVITVTPICSDLPETTSVKFRRFACRAFVAPKTWVQVS